MRVLLVEDDPEFASFVRRVIGQYPDEAELVCAEKLSEGLKIAGEGAVDAVLLDLGLPDAAGLDGLRRLRALDVDLPIVILTSTQDERIAVDAVKAGAQDYLIKGGAPEQIMQAVRYAVERQRGVTNFRNVILRDSEGMLIIDRNGIVRLANPAAESLLGSKSADLVGRACPFPMVAGEVQELGIKDAAGREIKNLEVNATATEWEGQQAYIASLRDVTEWKRMTRALKESNEKLVELDRMKTAFLSNVTHELRTPMTVVLSTANNLLDGALGPMPAAQKEWVAKIKTHTERLHALISDILDLSKLESGTAELQFSETDAAALVAKTLSSLDVLAQPKRIRLVSHVSSSLPKVWISPGRIEQVLTNLVGNAVKFSPDGGEICVSAVVSGADIEFRVSDQGPGIPPEYRETVFDRFRQLGTKDGRPSTRGIGLGLAICREIIQQHKGLIWVEGGTPSGAVFVFQVPVDCRAQGKGRAKTALVVDDDPRICDLMSFILARMGLETSVNWRGDDAVVTLQDPASRFDLVFLDMMLPGMSGVEVAKMVRKFQPQAKIVIVTAYPKSDLSLQSMGPDVTLMSKPFNLQDVERVVRESIPSLTQNIKS